MKRYHAQPISPVHGVCIVDDPHGEYVRYEDAQAEIHRLIDLLSSAFMDGVDAGLKARENFAETMKQFEQWQKQQEGK